MLSRRHNSLATDSKGCGRVSTTKASGGRRRDLEKLEVGWVGTGEEASRPAPRERPSINEDLLHLQAGWCNRPAPRRWAKGGGEAAGVLGGEEDADPDEEEIRGGHRRCRVKGGAVNYDAPLYLKGLESFKARVNAGGGGGLALGFDHRRTLPSSLKLLQSERGSSSSSSLGGTRSGSGKGYDPTAWAAERRAQVRAADFLRAQRRAAAATQGGEGKGEGGGDDASFWREWQAKWDFVYDFVEQEKARLKEAKRREQLGEQLLLLEQQQRRGLQPPPRLPRSQRPWSTTPTDGEGGGATAHKGSSSSSDNRGGRGERRTSVEDLPEYPKEKGQGSKAASASTGGGGSEPRPLRSDAAAAAAVADVAWAAFEGSWKDAASLRVEDIPFPDPGASVMGLGPAGSTPPAEAKKRIRQALLRWHPDKFQRVLAKIADPAERVRAVGLVQDVTRRIIAEKGASGV